MGDVSVWRAVAPSFVVLAVMAAIASLTASLARLDSGTVLLDYLLPAVSVTLAAIPIWAGGELFRLAMRRSECPGTVIWSRLRAVAPMLALPTLVQPLFFTAFTIAKTALAVLESFRWDAVFTRLDALIFGVDPWRLTSGVIGVAESRMLEFLYTAGWGLGLVFVQVFVVLAASRRFAGRFFLAMNLCWLIGGIAIAYMFPAAGPVFAHLFDPALAGHFDVPNAALHAQLLSDGPILRTQAYLVSALGTADVEAGGGISAMPSIHVAVAMLYVMAARRTRWAAAAAVFALLTFLGSIHFGYHYAIDGLVAAGVAIVCWKAATLYFQERLDAAPLMSRLRPVPTWRA